MRAGEILPSHAVTQESSEANGRLAKQKLVALQVVPWLTGRKGEMFLFVSVYAPRLGRPLNSESLCISVFGTVTIAVGEDELSDPLRPQDVQLLVKALVVGLCHPENRLLNPARKHFELTDVAF